MNDDGRARIAAIAAASPWLNLTEAAAYEGRGKRWLAKEAKHGRVRCARLGGRGEYTFRKEWLDQHLEDQAHHPVMSPRRAFK